MLQTTGFPEWRRFAAPLAPATAQEALVELENESFRLQISWLSGGELRVYRSEKEFNEDRTGAGDRFLALDAVRASYDGPANLRRFWVRAIGAEAIFQYVAYGKV